MTTQSQTLSVTGRTRLRRHSERGKTEYTDLLAVLDAGMICHFGVVVDGAPLVLPTAYGRIGDTLYLHGSSANRSLHAADGHEVCVTVTHIDGLVCARSVFSHSVNYRSAVVHGHLVALGGDEAADALTRISECLMPGRSAEVPFHTAKQLAATAALAMDIVQGQWTVKVRDAGPGEPEPGQAEPGLWTGVLPIVGGYGPPQTSSHVPADTPVSPSVLNVLRRSARPGRAAS